MCVFTFVHPVTMSIRILRGSWLEAAKVQIFEICFLNNPVLSSDSLASRREDDPNIFKCFRRDGFFAVNSFPKGAGNL